MADHFVGLFSLEHLHRLFKYYDQGCYDHLLTNPRKPLLTKDMRNGLRFYYEDFVAHKKEEDERTAKIQSLVDGEITIDQFIFDVAEDQHMLEPLIHMTNQQTKDLIFRPQLFDSDDDE